MLREVIGNKSTSQSATWFICRGKPGNQLKTDMQMRGELPRAEPSAAVDRRFPAETSVSAF